MKKFSIIVAAVVCVAAAAVALRFALSSPEPESADFAPSEVVYGDVPGPAAFYPSAPGTAEASNKHASIDYSNAAQGYITVHYTGSFSGGDPLMKVFCGGEEYTYFLGDGEDAFPLTCGDGNYTVKVYRCLGSGQYSAVLKKTFEVKLENQLLPYLYPSRMVSYTESSIAVTRAAELCRDAANDLEILKIIYAYITENITYDYRKAANIEKGYVSSVDATYISRRGICFDYSAILAAMLRTQNIPVKLVTGYLNGTSVFHAWNEVYLKNSGWVTVSIPVTALSFRMLDTTLAASQGDEAIAKKLDDPAVYAPTYRY